MDRITVDGDILRFTQIPGQGFFSCCTIHLQGILKYVNEYGKLPRLVDSTGQFQFYKTPETWTRDIKSDYFESDSHGVDIMVQAEHPVKVTHQPVEEQYSDYRYLNFAALKPFIQRYFSPATTIRALASAFCVKYQMNLEKTCVLFYRGNDKVTETPLPSYEHYMNIARELLDIHPDLRIWVQSDETEFLNAMKTAFPDNHVIFYDEIRHMPCNPETTVDKVFHHQNAEMSKNYLAITYLMSQCKYVVCGSGNCSIWIALLRGNADGMVQFCAQKPA